MVVGLEEMDGLEEDADAVGLDEDGVGRALDEVADGFGARAAGARVR